MKPSSLNGWLQANVASHPKGAPILPRRVSSFRVLVLMRNRKTVSKWNQYGTKSIHFNLLRLRFLIQSWKMKACYLGIFTRNSPLNTASQPLRGSHGCDIDAIPMGGSHRIHGTNERYIYLHECLICMVNVGKYTSPMDPMSI